MAKLGVVNLPGVVQNHFYLLFGLLQHSYLHKCCCLHNVVASYLM